MKIAISTLILFFFCNTFAQEARLLRFPTVHGEQVVFSYAGDLYKVNRSGGVARKLTSDIGYEMFPKFSPDGKTIAFTGQFDGNTEVYTISSFGGEPQRVSYTATLFRDRVDDRMGPNNIVLGWKGGNILFRSRMKSFNSFKGQVYEVSPEGELPKQLPFSEAGWMSYSANKTKVAYNRVFREFRTWKYYRGGMADDVFIYDFTKDSTINITRNPAQDIFPMWHEDMVYFLSDRERTMNLYSYNTTTQETKKETNFDEFDIKFPSIGDDYIIFENGGYLHTYDLHTSELKKISIEIKNDISWGRDKYVNVKNMITHSNISSAGNRLMITARGDLFDVPVEDGSVKNMFHTSGVHEREASYSSNGKNVAFISDETGEDEIFILKLKEDGHWDKVEITEKTKSYKYGLKWSPDSKKLLWSDRHLRLMYYDLETQKVTKVKSCDADLYHSYNWSPDSKWIVYSEPTWQSVHKVYVYNLKENKNSLVSNEWFEATSPSWSNDGKYLFYVSNRTFSPIFSHTEWNHAYLDMGKIYMVPLLASMKTPFDVVNTLDGQKEEKAKEGNEVAIDFEGIENRVVELPVPVGNYWNLESVEGKLYYMTSADVKHEATWKYFDFDKKKETLLGKVRGYRISGNEKKVLVYKSSKELHVIDLPSSAVKLTKAVDLSGLETFVNMDEEWNHIFEESHRQYKYFFYDHNMHGVDWEAMKRKYQSLVKHVKHRSDLTYIIGEMIGELNVGHAYVGNGDVPSKPRIKMGLLGCEIATATSGYFKITKIYKGEPWGGNQRSPFHDPGVDVKEGEYLLEVNGVDLKSVNNPYKLLIGKANKQVELRVSPTGEMKESRLVYVVPIADESELIYRDWVDGNIKLVDKLTGGKVAYLHIPDMVTHGLNEFVRHFYPQRDKQALIIDDRGNGGGNVSPQIMERLSRKLELVNYTRYMKPHSNPYQMIAGPKVMLIDKYSASDGDIFPYRFRMNKTGALIGERTWGGVVGYRGHFKLIDGGFIVRPEFAHFNVDGSEWVIEGRGVNPDIEVNLDPVEAFKGNDAQLERAIKEILIKLKTDKGEIPSHPPFEDKSK